MRLIKNQERDVEFKPTHKNNHIKRKQSKKHAIKDRHCQIEQKSKTQIQGAYKKLTLNLQIQIFYNQKYGKRYQSRFQRKEYTRAREGHFIMIKS